MSRLTAAAAVLAVSLLAACGSDDSDDATTAKTTAAAATATTAAAATPKLPLEELVARCHTTMDPIVAALRDAGGALNADGDYTAYRASMRQLRAAFYGVDFKAIAGSNCLGTVIPPAQEANKYYQRAQAAWAACNKRDNCDKQELAGELALFRSKAKLQTDDAEGAIVDIQAT